jgi:uncharacterized protein YuzE
LLLASLYPGRGKYETSWDITEDRPVGLVADLTAEGRCIGIEFWNAAEQLLPHLLPGEFQKTDIKTALIVDYDRDSDALHLHAGKSGNRSETVIEGWTAHYDTNKDPSEEWSIGEIEALLWSALLHIFFLTCSNTTPRTTTPTGRNGCAASARAA